MIAGSRVDFMQQIGPHWRQGVMKMLADVPYERRGRDTGGNVRELELGSKYFHSTYSSPIIASTSSSWMGWGGSENRECDVHAVCFLMDRLYRGQPSKRLVSFAQKLSKMYTEK